MRRALALFSLSVLLAAPILASGPSEVVEPDLEGVLHPCCGNETDADPGNRAVLDQRPMPDHSLLPPEILEQWKKEQLLNPDAPAGTALLEGGEERAVIPKAAVVRASFDGMNSIQAGHQGIIGFPPDTIVAASPNRVLEASNVALRLSQRNGKEIVRRSLNNFFGVKYPPILFDPKVYYDRLSNRFFLLAVSVDDGSRQAFIYFSVARSADPSSLDAPGDFCNYRIPAKVGQSWADYPGLGMNEKWVGIAVNNFNFSGSFRSVFLYAIDKTRLVQNAAGCPSIKFYRLKAGQDGNGQVAFTVQPAQHYSASGLEGSPLFFVSSELTNGNSTRYTLWRLFDNPAGGPKPRLARYGLMGEIEYSVPPHAPQKGGSDLDTGDPRVQQAAYRNGELWAVHTTGCNFGAVPGESCFKVVGIAPSNDGGDIFYEEIVGGGEGWYFWMPGIAINQVGDLMVVYQRSRSGMSVGVGFAGREADAGFEAGKLVNGKCGLDNFDGDSNRTGDYVGVQTDPADNLGFWIAGEYTGKVGHLGCDWRTRIGRVVF